MTSLELLGERLIKRVRDETITDWTLILDGTMKGSRANEIRALIPDANRELIKTVIPQVVDAVLHKVLVWLEADPSFSICARTGNDFEAMEDISDGLAGELYGENGWLAKYGNSS